MANEINAQFTAGSNLYAVIQQTAGSAVGQFWNATTAALEAYNGASWTSTKYCIALSELTTGGSAGFYKADFPDAAPKGDYSVMIYQRAGGSPAVSDLLVRTGVIYWSGSAEQAQSTMLAGYNANGQVQIQYGTSSGQINLTGGNLAVASDPWTTSLPGSYAAGTAGNILGMAITDLLEADRWIDTSVTPWALVLIKKGSGTLQTGTELLRQKLYDTAGANVIAPATVIGRAIT